MAKRRVDIGVDTDYINCAGETAKAGFSLGIVRRLEGKPGGIEFLCELEAMTVPGRYVTLAPPRTVEPQFIWGRPLIQYIQQ